jgi:hypothetical protein
LLPSTPFAALLILSLFAQLTLQKQLPYAAPSRVNTLGASAALVVMMLTQQSCTSFTSLNPSLAFVLIVVVALSTSFLLGMTSLSPFSFW